MTMTIGRTTSSAAPKTDVSHGPRSGLRHRIRDSPGGGCFSSVRHNTAGKPCSGGSSSFGFEVCTCTYSLPWAQRTGCSLPPVPGRYASSAGYSSCQRHHWYGGVCG